MSPVCTAEKIDVINRFDKLKFRQDLGPDLGGKRSVRVNGHVDSCSISVRATVNGERQYDRFDLNSTNVEATAYPNDDLASVAKMTERASSNPLVTILETRQLDVWNSGQSLTDANEKRSAQIVEPAGGEAFYVHQNVEREDYSFDSTGLIPK